MGARFARIQIYDDLLQTSINTNPNALPLMEYHATE